jgi:hypothetical protein
MTDSTELMNQLIRMGRGDPVDPTDAASVNRSIREAAGRPVPAPAPPLPPPPLPGDDQADYNHWADDAAAAGVSAHELARYTARWVAQHRQVLADRDADQ